MQKIKLQPNGLASSGQGSGAAADDEFGGEDDAQAFAGRRRSLENVDERGGGDAAERRARSIEYAMNASAYTAMAEYTAMMEISSSVTVLPYVEDVSSLVGRVAAQRRTETAFRS